MVVIVRMEIILEIAAGISALALMIIVIAVISAVPALGGTAISNYTVRLNSSMQCGQSAQDHCANGTYLMTTRFAGTPQVPWDECISNLEYLKNGRWLKANLAQENEVLAAYGYVDIWGMC